jgi:hypothetical protein
MDEFFKMDVFFVITSAVTILIGVGMGFILWRIWKILGHVERIAGMFEEGTETLKRDITAIREAVSDERVWFMATVVRFLRRALGRNFGKKK